MKAEKKKCPRGDCGKPGSGPYARWVLNGRNKRYEPYYYFAHRSSNRTKWCYIPRKVAEELLSNKKEPTCRRCSQPTILDRRLFCCTLQGFLAPEMLSRPQDCFEERRP